MTTQATLTTPEFQAPEIPLPVQRDKDFWRRADDTAGFVLFLLIMGGGVVAPFALYFYGLLFR